MSNTCAAQEKPAVREALRVLEWTNLRRLSEARTLLAIVAVLVVKTGLPGVAWVRLDPNVAWPAELEVRLPP